jgi:hypothetical protein
MSKIYINYRGEDYLDIRKRWEPWYSDSYNENHDSRDWVISRCTALATFLSKHIESSLDTIVDVGGDRGQYIPDIASKKIVLDLSEKKLVPGVERIKSLNEISKVDLIVYAHVLEHVADPLLELEDLLEKSRYVYIEVPFGAPEINKNRKNRIRYTSHLIASFSTEKWKSRTIPSTGREVPSNRMLSQSEHLTFFTEPSMRYLAQNLGAEIVIEKGIIQTPDFNEATVLQCLMYRV